MRTTGAELQAGALQRGHEGGEACEEVRPDCHREFWAERGDDASRFSAGQLQNPIVSKRGAESVAFSAKKEITAGKRGDCAWCFARGPAGESTGPCFFFSTWPETQ